MVLLAIALVCVGVIGLGVVESREDDELRRARPRQAASNYRYAKSWLALALPVSYCLLDAAGTFADSRVLTRLDPDAANCAYELTISVRGGGVIRVCQVHPARPLPAQTRGAEVHRRAVPEQRPVRVHLRHRGRGPRHVRRTHHLGLLRRVRALEPHLPARRLIVAALSHAAADRRRHRADWHSRPVSAHSITRPPRSGGRFAEYLSSV